MYMHFDTDKLSEADRKVLRALLGDPVSAQPEKTVGQVALEMTTPPEETAEPEPAPKQRRARKTVAAVPDPEPEPEDEPEEDLSTISSAEFFGDNELPEVTVQEVTAAATKLVSAKDGPDRIRAALAEIGKGRDKADKPSRVGELATPEDRARFLELIGA